MFRLYTPVILLQAFCLYHAYSNRVEQKWYYIIIFLPLIGSVLYLYHHFYSRDNLDLVTEGVKKTLNPNYTVEKLTEKAQVADTISNKIRLADEFKNSGQLDQAIVLYESCLTGFNAEDPEVIKKLLLTYYEAEQYDKVLPFSNLISSNKSFVNSDAKLAVAWSLFYTGDVEGAEQLFKELDLRYSNHAYRYEYALFLTDVGRADDARKKLEELVDEIDLMESHEKSLKGDVIRNVKLLYKSL